MRNWIINLSVMLLTLNSPISQAEECQEALQAADKVISLQDEKIKILEEFAEQTAFERAVLKGQVEHEQENTRVLKGQVQQNAIVGLVLGIVVGVVVAR